MQQGRVFHQRRVRTETDEFTLSEASFPEEQTPHTLSSFFF